MIKRQHLELINDPFKLDEFGNPISVQTLDVISRDYRPETKTIAIR